MSVHVLLQLVNRPLDAVTIVFIFSTVTAAVGAFVAYQAYRGYRRNDSQPMLYLSAGIVSLTIVPFVASSILQAFTAASDAQILLTVTMAHIAGVAAIFYALTGTSRT